MKRLHPDLIFQCRVCQWTCIEHGAAYYRTWFRCEACGFLQVEISQDEWQRIHQGEGLTAGTSVSGVRTPGFRPGSADGGYREYFLARLCFDDLGARRILLYGTGNTRTLERLREEGYRVDGCDFSEDVITARREQFGPDAFFHPNDFPDTRYDAVIVVEVIEHFVYPLRSFWQLFRHLSGNGVICGTTDFYDGTDISDHVYLRTEGHVAYWSDRSLRKAASLFDKSATLFELICPGSVKPDKKFGLLWPRKRVFALHDPDENYFLHRLAREPILPIDKP